MPTPIQLPEVPDAERTPLVERLVVLIEALVQENWRQAETIQRLRDEIAVLKGEKAKPTFKPSGMEEETAPDVQTPGEAGAEGEGPPKRPGSHKRSKTRQLTIQQEIPVPPVAPLPAGSRFKGYRDFVVQDLTIETFNTRYRLEVWQTPAGEWWCGELPATLAGSHFGPRLRAFVLYQHHHCQVTQPLLHEQLGEWGVDISVGQVDALLSGEHAAFGAEKDHLLVTGLQVSAFITVDDSGARHQGRNGYVTQIGNAWFSSTSSKNRINFLELLHAGDVGYGLNPHALDYLREQGLPQEPRRRLQAQWPAGGISDPQCWEKHLDTLGIDSARHRRIATEGALLGGLIDKGFSLDPAIVSDGAGQFAILLHALCWVHAERLVHTLIPLNERHRQDQQRVRTEIWELYADLKAYQRAPEPTRAPVLAARFDAIFTQRTGFETLNQTLKRLHAHRQKLLLVLQRPDIPLHTNGSENDIRGDVKWRIVSGGTRSDRGKRCRDTFASLKKTCRKLGVSCWAYLVERIEQHGAIASLPAMVRERALGMP